MHYLQEIGSFRSCFCSGAGLTTWLVTALGLGLMAGRADGIRFGLVLGLLLGFGLSIEETAWLRYVLSKGWLALHGRLPWSLIREWTSAGQAAAPGGALAEPGTRGGRFRRLAGG